MAAFLGKPTFEDPKWKAYEEDMGKYEKNKLKTLSKRERTAYDILSKESLKLTKKYVKILLDNAAIDELQLIDNEVGRNDKKIDEFEKLMERRLRKKGIRQPGMPPIHWDSGPIYYS